MTACPTWHTDVDAITRQLHIESQTQVCDTIAGRAVTRAELSEWFARVAPANWKDRIDAEVTLAPCQVPVLIQAVIFFTGSMPELFWLGQVEPGRLAKFRVVSAGYYATCGA